jgi:probable HAF family extracellular repeat protein
VWHGPGTYSELGLPSGAFGVASGINNTGVVVGWAQGGDNLQRPFRWRGSFEWLAAREGAAIAINSHDVTVGEVWDDVDGVFEAAAWTASGQPLRLSPATHEPHLALSVNDNNLAVGYRRSRSTGVTRAMLWPIEKGSLRTDGRPSALRSLVLPRPASGADACVTDRDALISRATLIACLAKAGR